MRPTAPTPSPIRGHVSYCRSYLAPPGRSHKGGNRLQRESHWRGNRRSPARTFHIRSSPVAPRTLDETHTSLRQARRAARGEFTSAPLRLSAHTIHDQSPRTVRALSARLSISPSAQVCVCVCVCVSDKPESVAIIWTIALSRCPSVCRAAAAAPRASLAHAISPARAVRVCARGHRATRYYRVCMHPPPPPAAPQPHPRMHACRFVGAARQIKIMSGATNAATAVRGGGVHDHAAPTAPKDYTPS